MKIDPDRELVEACQATTPSGLEGAFRALYDQFKDRVYNVCYRITGNPADAARCLAGDLRDHVPQGRRVPLRVEVLELGLPHRGQCFDRPQASFEHGALTSLEAGADSDVAATRPNTTCATSASRCRSPAASRHELEAEIQSAIARLSPKMRAITVLRYVENLSYDEIAESLQISLGTVKSRLSRAHEALDRELTPRARQALPPLTP
jgi:RNA polymerase sigma-70 factor (ECF subfamily)